MFEGRTLAEEAATGIQEILRAQGIDPDVYIADETKYLKCRNKCDVWCLQRRNLRTPNPSRMIHTIFLARRLTFERGMRSSLPLMGWFWFPIP